MILLETTAKIPHIVLANDNPDECLIFRDALENLNIQHIFSLAENGAMLLNMLDEIEFLPEFIFIDLDMKGISGKDCLKAIRTSKKLDDVPVIVYSSVINYQSIADCYNEKANMYVVKTNYVSTLTNLLESLLQIPASRLLSVQKEEFLQTMSLS